MAKCENGSYNNNENILKCICNFDKTGDKKELWACYDDLFHAVKSLMWKRLRGFPTPNLDDNCRLVTEKWMLDIIKRKSKGKVITNMQSPISYAHFMILRYWPTDDTIMNTAVHIEAKEEHSLEEWLIGERNYYDSNDYDPYGDISDDVCIIK